MIPILSFSRILEEIKLTEFDSSFMSTSKKDPSLRRYLDNLEGYGERKAETITIVCSPSGCYHDWETWEDRAEKPKRFIHDWDDLKKAFHLKTKKLVLGITDSEQACILLKLLKQDTTISTLRIHLPLTYRINDHFQLLLIDLLKTNSTLTSFSIPNAISSFGSCGVASLCESLYQNTSLLKLKIYNYSMDPESVLSFSRLLNINSSLKVLKLHDKSGIGNSGVGDFIDKAGIIAIGKSLEKNSTLTSIHIGCNKLYPDGVQSLSESLNKNTTLKQLDICCGFSRFFGETLEIKKSYQLPKDFLKNASCLTTLILTRNRLNDSSIEGLSLNLTSNQTLSILNLYCNNITDFGASKLFNSIRHNTTLTNLDLGCNYIRLQQSTLDNMLMTNFTLKRLNLSYNPVQNKEVSSLCKWLEYNTSIQKLCIWDSDNACEARQKLHTIVAHNRGNLILSFSFFFNH